MSEGAIVIVGGTQGLGRRLAEHYAERGRDVLIAGRDPARTNAVAQEIGASVPAQRHWTSAVELDV